MIPNCGETAASCVCINDADHEGPHDCECGGSWTGEGESFLPLKVPGTGAVWNNKTAMNVFLSSLGFELRD